MLLVAVSLFRRASVAPVVLALLLALLATVVEDWTTSAAPSTSAAAVATVVDGCPHDDAPAQPHCAHGPAAGARMALAVPQQEYVVALIDDVNPPDRARIPTLGALAMAALAATRTPAALQVFRR